MKSLLTFKFISVLALHCQPELNKTVASMASPAQAQFDYYSPNSPSYTPLSTMSTFKSNIRDVLQNDALSWGHFSLLCTQEHVPPNFTPLLSFVCESNSSLVYSTRSPDQLLTQKPLALQLLGYAVINKQINMISIRNDPHFQHAHRSRGQ